MHLQVHGLCKSCNDCFLVVANKFAGGKAKAKPKAGASKGQPLSDVALAGKTVPEKMALVRACLIFTCVKKLLHIFFPVLDLPRW